MPVPIPALLGHADDLGVLALEDLGDVVPRGYPAVLGGPLAATGMAYTMVVGDLANELQDVGVDGEKMEAVAMVAGIPIAANTNINRVNAPVLFAERYLANTLSTASDADNDTSEPQQIVITLNGANDKPVIEAGSDLIDDPLVEIQTDKTTVEIPSPAAGTVALGALGAVLLLPAGVASASSVALGLGLVAVVFTILNIFLESIGS